MSTAKDLKDLFSAGRPLVEQWLDVTKQLNRLLMRAWRAGYLDECWDELRKNFPGTYLHYFIRMRGIGDIKIGKTNHIDARFKTLLTYAPRGADMIACYPGNQDHEAELKHEFRHLRLKGEWFVAGDEILDHLHSIGTNVQSFSDDVVERYVSSNGRPLARYRYEGRSV